MLTLISRRLLIEQDAEGSAAAVDLARLGTNETTHLIRWNEGVSAGVVEIEAADSANYAGTWAPVSTVTFDGSTVAAPKVEYVRVAGAYKALRHRISTIVTDGTVTTRIQGA